MELKEIINGCQEGCQKAQRALYNTYSGLLMSICLRYSQNEAEDVLQMSFMKIFKNIHQYQGTGSFEGWMKRITVNTAVTHYRQKNPLNKATDIDDFHTELNNKQASALSQMTVNELIDLINGLADKYRIAFNLYAIEGYKHTEIAEMLHITEGTSKSQVSRARKMIQEQLERITQQEKIN